MGERGSSSVTSVRFTRLSMGKCYEGLSRFRALMGGLARPLQTTRRTAAVPGSRLSGRAAGGGPGQAGGPWRPDQNSALAHETSPANGWARGAERVGFEPTDTCVSTVFKTVSFGRSDTSPRPPWRPGSPWLDLRSLAARAALLQFAGRPYPARPPDQADVRATASVRRSAVQPRRRTTRTRQVAPPEWRFLGIVSTRVYN